MLTRIILHNFVVFVIKNFGVFISCTVHRNKLIDMFINNNNGVINKNSSLFFFSSSIKLAWVKQKQWELTKIQLIFISLFFFSQNSGYTETKNTNFWKGITQKTFGSSVDHFSNMPIYNTVKIRPKDFCNFVFFRKGCIISISTIFSSFSFFSVKLNFKVFQKDLLSVILLTLRLLLKFLFVFLISLTKILRCLLYANSLRNKFSFLNLLRRRVRRSWEAFTMSSYHVPFLRSSRLTFSKENLQSEFRSFILIMLRWFSKVLIAFFIGSLCFVEISQRLMLRPSIIPFK